MNPFTISPDAFVIAVDLLAFMRRLPRYAKPGTPVEYRFGEMPASNPCGFDVDRALTIRHRYWNGEENIEFLVEHLPMKMLRTVANLMAVNLLDEKGAYGGKPWDMDWIFEGCDDVLIRLFKRYLAAFATGEITSADLKKG